jgi:hypothetical protein
VGQHPEDSTLAPFDPAHARAIVKDALDHHDMMLNPPTSDTWPIVRPLVSWLTGRLPTTTSYLSHVTGPRAR